jgi:hypothetical protein
VTRKGDLYMVFLKVPVPRLCAIGVRGAHCIKFSTRTDRRVL